MSKDQDYLRYLANLERKRERRQGIGGLVAIVLTAPFWLGFFALAYSFIFH